MPQIRLVLLAPLVLVSFSGCQSMIKQEDVIPNTVETVTVQLRPAYGKSKNIEVPLEPNMRLQDVIEKSNVKFRNKLAHIVRTSPLTGQPHKLEADFGSNRRISMATDYAVQPGDRIVIAQDTRSSIERVMFEVLGRG